MTSRKGRRKRGNKKAKNVQLSREDLMRPMRKRGEDANMSERLAEAEILIRRLTRQVDDLTKQIGVRDLKLTERDKRILLLQHELADEKAKNSELVRKGA